MNLVNLIKYYRFCFIEENRSQLIANFFAKSVEDRYFFEQQEQLASGFYPYIPLDDDFAEKIFKKIKISSAEKELIYSALFIAGKTVAGKIIFSPLVIFPAEVFVKDDFYYLKIDNENRRLNLGIFNEISNNTEELSIFFDEFYKIIGGYNLDIPTVQGISQLLEKTFSVKCDFLAGYPDLITVKQIKKILNNLKAEEFYLLPVAALGIMKKSVNIRGIINELETMSETDDFSTAVKSIYAGKVNIKEKSEEIGFVPSILSQAQQKALENSAVFSHLIIVGPPGTGKSYTIASIAVEKITKKQSVLITAATDKAVDIIADKIENQLGIKNLVVRAGRKDYKKQLVEFLEKVLKGQFPKIDDYKGSAFYRKQILKLKKQIRKSENLFNRRVKQELKRSSILKDKLSGPAAFWITFLNKHGKRHWKITAQLYEYYDRLTTAIRKYIENLYFENLQKAVRFHYEDLKNLLRAIRSRTGIRKDKFWSQLNFEVLFDLFPVWLVKLSDLYTVFPLRKELFDYVIIDEATQIDLASPLPALQRAKNCIVTGDPKQLRHFSFLSKAKQEIFEKKLNLEDVPDFLTDYRTSLIDLVSENAHNVEQFVFLDEHFRSLPAIIEFSNRKFYDGRLKIMSERPDLPSDLGIETVFCNGKRNDKGINIAEADAILQRLKKIITEQKDLPPSLADSIGILSPFRDQAEYLSKRIMADFSLDDINKHKIRIDTPYGFQGDERDIMLLSFVLDNDAHPTAFRYLDNHNVFNVAITRAAKLQVVFHSLDIENFNAKNILREYIEDLIKKRKQKIKSVDIENKFLKEIEEFLKSQGFQVWKTVYIAGILIDLIVKKNNKFWGIDLLGYTGEIAGTFGIEKYKILSRSGLKIFPFPYSYWLKNRDELLTDFFKEVE